MIDQTAGPVEGKEATGISRGQNVVYQMPHDWASIAHFLGPLVDRVDPDMPELQLLIVASDAESAAMMAAAAVRLADDRTIGVIAATGAARAARLLRLGSTQILAGDPVTLLELARASLLKLGSVRGIAIAWADELIALGHASQLETLFVDLPKDAARTVVTTHASPDVDALVERYARRARRVVAPPGDELAGVVLQYVTSSAYTRLPVLRRLVDDVDPVTATVYVRTDESEREVAELLRSLGYHGPDAPIRVSRGGASADLAVLFDLPASREELREAVGAEPRRVVALVQPRQISSLRALATGGSVVPLTLSPAATKARGHDDALRGELRAILDGCRFGRELLTLEPLLDDFDGIEIAAAVLQLLEADRARPVAQAAPVSTGEMKRVFLGVGMRDSIKPGDLVGAIAAEGGITSAEIGKIEIRESHSIVEIASHVVAAVIPKIDGITIKGRKVPAREDLGRDDRPGAGRADARGSRDSRSPGRDRPSRTERPSRTGGSGAASRDRAPDSRAGGRDDRPRRPTGPPRSPRPRDRG